MNAQETIMNYLNEVAKQDNALATHLKTEKLKTPQKMMKYICEEAKKVAEKESSVCIADDQVFQWARHYWLDYEEKEVKETPIQAKVISGSALPKTPTKTAKKEVAKPTQKKEEKIGQLSLFDDLF